MEPETVNRLKDNEIHGDFVGRDKITNIIMFQESEREFVVTHNASIKPVAYFTGRETELKELCQRVEEKRKAVLVSGMGGIGKTHICRKLFEEYLNKHADAEDIPFCHIGYIEYNGDMGSSLKDCLKFKQQDDSKQNKEAAWKELEYLASDGKLLLFVDNVDRPIAADLGLQRLKGIPGAVILTSRQATFSDEFEPYRIGFLDMEQCKAVYEKIRFRGSERKVGPEEVPDLEYIIESLVGRHTITVEFLAHLTRTKLWTVKRLRDELEEKGFQLVFHKGGELVNIQKSYEALYDLSDLTEAEQNILEAFSVFPYIPLAAETCNEWLLTDADVSEDDDILMGLYQKGWLQFYMEQEGYALHPVFAQFIYEKCKPNGEKHLGLIDACQKCLTIPDDGLVLERQKFITFAENIVWKLEMKNNIEKAEFIEAVARCFLVMENPQKAEEFYEIALEIYQSICGEEHYNTIRCIYGLAESNEFQDISKDKSKKARELYEKCLHICKKVLGDEHPYTIRCYNILAWLYSSSREMQLNYFVKVYKFCLKKLGKKNFYTCVAYENVERVYHRWSEKDNFKQWRKEKMKKLN